MAPWFFVWDHTNYARWLPIHLKDMTDLCRKHPTVYEQFLDGQFVVQRSNHILSSIALDQAHKQVNGILKDDGGIIVLTENLQALHKWIVATPEVIRIVQEF